MFKTKLVRFNVTTTPKPPKTNSVPINVVVVVLTHSKKSEQHVFKERELVKAKGAKDWQQEKHLQDSFIETVK